MSNFTSRKHSEWRAFWGKWYCENRKFPIHPHTGKPTVTPYILSSRFCIQKGEDKIKIILPSPLDHKFLQIFITLVFILNASPQILF